VSGYLRRLLGALGAYQLADVVSKLMGVVLLPVYTGYIPPSGYGTVEVFYTAVILASIVVRFGMIESFLRFHYATAEQQRRDALARRATVFLLLTTTAAVIPLAAFSYPLSKLVLARHDQSAFLIAVGGLWAFTNLELAYGLLRVQERLRAYATAAVTNVALTIAASLVLVVGLGQRADGLMAANYGATFAVLIGVWVSQRERLRGGTGAAAERFSVLLRFGLPTVPAEASVYLLSVVDRLYLVHARSLRLAGLYAIAVKFAGAIAMIVRAFQYAWPPLAYSVDDDAQAARLYGLVTTYYVLVSGWIVAGLALLGRWLLRVLTPHAGYFAANRAIAWVSLGWALYGLWVIFLVIAGRVRVTTRNFTAAAIGVAVNVGLLVALVHPLGLAGAGIALCGAYLAMLLAMYLLTRRLFVVRFEWRRLAQLVVVFAGLAVGGELLAPTHGVVGFITRAAVLLAMPLLLYLTGFAHERELAAARGLLARARRRPRPATPTAGRS
jgi:O-antigen/teichoic acid export membrane protein